MTGNRFVLIKSKLRLVASASRLPTLVRQEGGGGGGGTKEKNSWHFR